ncbi:hypothetical protein ACP70R_037262 [Stipagrostis hirtigluma subsp. patula]
MAAEPAEAVPGVGLSEPTVSLEESFGRLITPGEREAFMRGLSRRTHQVFQHDDSVGVIFLQGWNEMLLDEEIQDGEMVRVKFEFDEDHQYTVSRLQRRLDPNDDAGAFVVEGTRLSLAQWQFIRDLRVVVGPDTHLLVTTLNKRQRTTALHMPKSFSDNLPQGPEDVVFAAWSMLDAWTGASASTERLCSPAMDGRTSPSNTISGVASLIS